jgi:hypothetical protein
LATVKDDPEEFPGLRHHRSRRRRPPSSRRRTTQTSSLGCAKPRWSPSWRRTPSPKRGARRTTALMEPRPDKSRGVNPPGHTYRRFRGEWPVEHRNPTRYCTWT